MTRFEIGIKGALAQNGVISIDPDPLTCVLIERYMDTDAYKEGVMKTQEDGSHPQTQERGLRGNHVCMLCLSHLASRIMRLSKNIKPCCLQHTLHIAVLC